MPGPAVERLSRALQAVAEEEAIKARFQSQGIVSRPLGPREFDAYMKADMDRLAPIIKAAGVTAN